MSSNIFDVQEINDYMIKEKKKFYRELGEKIKETRKIKKITLNELSLKSLISSTYISQIERGEYGISLLKFITICNSLEINADDILRDFTTANKFNEELLCNKLQESKDISNNIINFIKYKK